MIFSSFFKSPKTWFLIYLNIVMQYFYVKESSILLQYLMAIIQFYFHGIIQDF